MLGLPIAERRSAGCSLTKADQDAPSEGDKFRRDANSKRGRDGDTQESKDERDFSAQNA